MYELKLVPFKAKTFQRSLKPHAPPKGKNGQLQKPMPMRGSFAALQDDNEKQTTATARATATATATALNAKVAKGER
jgi:hypothetical protein